MTQDALSNRINELLPQDATQPFMAPIEAAQREEKAQQAAANIKKRADAKAIAAQLQREKSILRRAEARLEERKVLAEGLGVQAHELPANATHAARKQAIEDKIEETRKRVRTLEAVRDLDLATPADPVQDAIQAAAATPSPTSAPASSPIRPGVEPQFPDAVPIATPSPSLSAPTATRPSIADLAAVSTTTRPEVVKLLSALNINLNLQLSKSDTSNLLACLLTCNEAQLHALQNNQKIPVVIKTVIKRLLEDMKLGNTTTIEKLWDRVFGKSAMSLDLPAGSAIGTGIIPNTPVSREAYIILRDTLIK